MAKQELYRIEFFDNERNAMPYCYFELYMNGHLVTGLPPKADSQGKIWINKQWVESTPSSPKELVVRFWNSEFPKTQHSETEKFIWPEGKTSIKAFYRLFIRLTQERLRMKTMRKKTISGLIIL
ncbi:Uncharacterised protein [Rodentibacter pneumotropicus]|uniref:Uncharacterized protein n=1 Tax=Rodentibacter pneumotropicus TaxID=758 RepID=A0A448MJ00_9PAST|nr:Uncharacterised protein [Rodentibacter pneumotropicus]